MNLVGAVAQGASDGLQLALNIAAMLIAFLALIALADFALGQAGALVGFVDSSGAPTLSFTIILSYAFAPVAWVIGVRWAEALDGGQLLGVKMVTNEFLAYEQLGEMIHRENPISERTKHLMTYALCGFSNFGAIGIQIGGIGSLAPGRPQRHRSVGTASDDWRHDLLLNDRLHRWHLALSRSCASVGKALVRYRFRVGFQLPKRFFPARNGCSSIFDPSTVFISSPKRCGCSLDPLRCTPILDARYAHRCIEQVSNACPPPRVVRSTISCRRCDQSVASNSLA